MLRMSSSLVGGIIVVAVAANAHAAPDAVARTQALVDAFKAVKPAPEDGSALNAADMKANATAFARLDAFFDYNTLTLEPIAPHKSKLSAAALKTFTSEFRELIRLVAYPNSGSFLNKARFQLSAGKSNKKTNQHDVNLKAYLEEEDYETTVTFHWKQSAEGLRIVDVSFDDASLLKDYRNQFTRIIKKDGIDGLLSKLHKRLEKERKESVAAL